METIKITLIIIILLPLLILSLRIAYKDSKRQLAKMGDGFEDLLPARTMFIGGSLFVFFTLGLGVIITLTGNDLNSIVEKIYSLLN